MLRYVYADNLAQFPKLRDSMFRDRAKQFSDRLGWDVSVDAQGFERDEYDAMNPLYVIWERADGLHGGSMRFLPTTGPTMVKDHFAHLLNGEQFESGLIWECTRFCLAPDAERKVAAALVLGAGELMDRFCLVSYIGVFDPRMERIYRLYGVTPHVVGASGQGADRIALGLWGMKANAFAPTLKRVGVTRQTSGRWFDISFGQTTTQPLAEIA